MNDTAATSALLKLSATVLYFRKSKKSEFTKKQQIPTVNVGTSTG